MPSLFQRALERFPGEFEFGVRRRIGKGDDDLDIAPGELFGFLSRRSLSGLAMHADGHSSFGRRFCWGGGRTSNPVFGRRTVGVISAILDRGCLFGVDPSGVDGIGVERDRRGLLRSSPSSPVTSAAPPNQAAKSSPNASGWTVAQLRLIRSDCSTAPGSARSIRVHARAASISSAAPTSPPLRRMSSANPQRPEITRGRRPTRPGPARCRGCV